MEKIVITGLGVVSPIGIGIDAFWKSCVEGKPGISKISSWDVSQYPCRIAGEIKDFHPGWAKPDRVFPKQFLPKPEDNEAKELLLQALDWQKNQKKEDIEKEKRADRQIT